MPELHFGDLVSVVVPAYNHERYIEQALDSVFQQTYEHLELIVLDDQSTDRTLESAHSWASRADISSRFVRIVIQQNKQNSGAHATINNGLGMARGNVLTILNSDDGYAPDRIRLMMTAAEANNSSLLFSGVHVIDTAGQRFCNSTFAAELESAIDEVGFFPSVSFSLLRKNIAVSTGNLLFSRVLFDRVGGFRPFRYCHDWDFLLRACLFTEPTAVASPLYYYRIHDANSFAALRLEQHLEPLSIYRHFFSACRAGKCTNPMAPWTTHWPGLFDDFIAEDASLKGAFDLVGGARIPLDRIAREISVRLGAC